MTDDGLISSMRNLPHAGAESRRGASRLVTMIDEALVEPKLRRATRPTRASKERRLQGKSLAGRTKKLRSRVRNDD